MRKSGWCMAAVAVLVALGSAATVLAGEETAPVAPATTHVVKHQTMCPVMGGVIDKKLFVDYKGKRIYVCCGMCVKTVKKDPAKYVTQLEAQGITLDKTPVVEPQEAGVPKN